MCGGARERARQRRQSPHREPAELAQRGRPGGKRISSRPGRLNAWTVRCSRTWSCACLAVEPRLGDDRGSESRRESSERVGASGGDTCQRARAFCASEDLPWSWRGRSVTGPRPEREGLSSAEPSSIGGIDPHEPAHPARQATVRTRYESAHFEEHVAGDDGIRCPDASLSSRRICSPWRRQWPRRRAYATRHQRPRSAPWP